MFFRTDLVVTDPETEDLIFFSKACEQIKVADFCSAFLDVRREDKLWSNKETTWRLKAAIVWAVFWLKVCVCVCITLQE